MKCPNCKFTCSTSRDLCPKCAFDLRPHKRALGETVQEPDAAYEDLKARAFGDSPTPYESEKLERAKTTKSGAFLGRFGKKDSGSQKNPAEPESAALSAPTEPQNKINRSLIDETAVMSLKEFQSSESSSLKLAPAPEEETKEEVVFKEVDSDFPKGLTSPSAKDGKALIVKPEQQSKPKKAEAVAPSIPVASSNPPSSSASNGGATKEICAFTPADYSFIDHGSVQSLFTEARTAISTDAMQTELDLWNFRTFENDEDIKVLFDLARDSVVDPTLEARLVNDISITPKREVKTDIVQAQLQRTVQKLSAPVLSLKGGKLNFGKKAAEASDENFVPRKTELPMPTYRRRALSFLIDLMLVSSVAMLFLFYLSLASRSTVISKILSGTGTTNLEFVPFVGTATHSILWAFLVYFGFVMLVFGNTVGAMVCKLKFVRDNGEEMTWSNIFVRTALLPMSYGLFGYMPILFGRRPFHDFMSRTVLSAEEKDNTPKIKRRKPVKLKKKKK